MVYQFSSIARIGGVASQVIEMIPKMCSEDSSIDCTKVPYAIYGILTIVGCVLMFGLPETKDEASPDNIEEGEVFGKVRLRNFNLFSTIFFSATIGPVSTNNAAV